MPRPALPLQVQLHLGPDAVVELFRQCAHVLAAAAAAVAPANARQAPHERQLGGCGGLAGAKYMSVRSVQHKGKATVTCACALDPSPCPALLPGEAT